MEIEEKKAKDDAEKRFKEARQSEFKDFEEIRLAFSMGWNFCSKYFRGIKPKEYQEWKNPDKIELKKYCEYWVLSEDNQVSRARYPKDRWVPYGKRLSNKKFMVAEIKPPELPR